MTYLLRISFFVLPLIAGCDAMEEPVATITQIDVMIQEVGNFIEIQDVAGRAYARAESFPAAVDVEVHSDSRDYFVIEFQSTVDGLRPIGASNAFNSSDLMGTSFTTSGAIEAVLTLN